MRWRLGLLAAVVLGGCGGSEQAQCDPCSGSAMERNVVDGHIWVFCQCADGDWRLTVDAACEETQQVMPELCSHPR